MDQLRPRRQGHFGNCTVEGCNDLTYVKKWGLCKTHYQRFKDKGNVNLETKTANCLWCGAVMNLIGFATAIQVYCSKKCNSASIRKRIKDTQTPEEKARDISYKYAWRLKKQYGMTVEDFQNLLVQQDYRCGICNRRQEDTNDGYLVVDHDHNSSYTRGLLCRQCNAGMGALGDSIDLLKHAILYLQNWSRNEIFIQNLSVASGQQQG